MNLTEMRARVREDLQDTDAATYQWTDDQVDGAIQRCVDEYSIRAPIEKMDDVTTALDDAELDISSLTGLLKIESIEFPIGQSPRYYQRYAHWAGRVFMTDKGDGNNARVKWLQKHTLDAGSTTIPAEHEEIIVLGATGYLAMTASIHVVDRANIAGRYGTRGFRAWGQDRLARYDSKLKAIAHARRTIQRTFYTDE